MLSTSNLIPPSSSSFMSQRRSPSPAVMSYNTMDACARYGAPLAGTSSPSSLQQSPNDFPSQFSYFDRSSAPAMANINSPLPPDVYSHKSGVPRTSNPPSCLASYMAYGTHQGSMPPTTRNNRTTTSPSVANRFLSLSSPTHGPTGSAPSLPRSVSADAAVPPPTSSPAVGHMVQRLAHQNSLIREAWEMERNHLEANRKRAEEVYKEERAIMEEVRDTWETERAGMAEEIRVLVFKMQALERENDELKGIIMQSPLNHDAGDGFSPVSANACSTDASTTFSGSSRPVGSTSSDVSFPLHPGSDDGPARPRFADGSFDSLSPTEQQPDMSSFIQLSSQSNQPHMDFLPSPRDETPVPIIDVQTIHPELEGIPIRATVVQKSTFTDTDQSSQSDSKPLSPTDSNGSRSRTEQTLEALAAGESQRLTMHAGHTPNHSLSVIPTTAGTVADPSQGSTPTQAQVTAGILGVKPADHQHESSMAAEAKSAPEDTYQESEYDSEASEPPLVAGDDAPLRGPLMIRNIPAKDEEFWRLVNEKLEPISREGAVPTVIEKPAMESTAAAPVPHTAPEELLSSKPAQMDSADYDDYAAEGEKEPDIPIRLKKTSNFGLPFGEV